MIFSARAFTQENRFNSFAPVRPNQLGQWFVDGEKYMASVANAIEQVFVFKRQNFFIILKWYV